ncbi:MAG: glycosyltransferase family 4 protein [Candidatus Rokubacteria bacterium]|nr:glycosyltransferase family 4 protein [Candidatus Rokubacteria bacterium]
MRILQLVSCRGWSSDAYWAARVSRELTARGHDVTLGCREGTEARVIDRARAEGVERVATFAFGSGLRPARDTRDVRRLLAWLPRVDLIHVHRGKEHWLAAAANRLSATPRPIVRTRHIAHAVRAHAANRWLYGRATALVVTVTEAIRGQYLAAGLVSPERVVALPGGADVEAYAPRAADPRVRVALGGAPDVPVVGMIGGLRVMKGHRVVVDAAARLRAAGVKARVVFVGRGTTEGVVREAIARQGLHDMVATVGFAADVPAVMAALDVALYTPLESDGMSRVVFEYLAAGRALVASRVGAVPEVLTHDETALLVPAGDAVALAEALARLLADGGRRARLGAAGHRLVAERYSGGRLAAALEAHYARLVAA